MSDSNNQISTGAHPTGSNHHPGLVDIPNKGEDNLTDSDKDKDNSKDLVKKTEKEKNQELTDSDFDEFNLDKVDELEKNKEKDFDK